MAGISQTELQLRLIFLIRLLKVDTVFCYDPWGHDEENPDHYVLGHCVEAACWMAGREHDYPEQFAAGLKTHAVSEKYYYARHPAVTRVVDISAVVDKKVEANRCNRAKGPGGGHGSRLRNDFIENSRHVLTGWRIPSARQVRTGNIAFSTGYLIGKRLAVPGPGNLTSGTAVAMCKTASPPQLGIRALHMRTRFSATSIPIPNRPIALNTRRSRRFWSFMFRTPGRSCPAR